MDERKMLLEHLSWLMHVVIPAFSRSDLPPSWKAESLRRALQQVADIRWRLETDPPRPYPNYDESKPYRDRVHVERQPRKRKNPSDDESLNRP